VTPVATTITSPAARSSIEKTRSMSSILWPGSAPSFDLPLALTLACTMNRLTPAEALRDWGRTHAAREASYMEEAWTGREEDMAGIVAARGAGDYGRLALDLVDALNGDGQRVMILDVPNRSSLPFLDEEAIVEVPCVIGRGGVVPISHTQDTIGSHGRTVADAAAVLTAIAGVEDTRDSATSINHNRPRLDYTTFLDKNALKKLITDCYRKYGNAKTAEFLDAIKSIAQCDFSDRLPEISCPTLIVWGQDDELVPVSDAYAYERLIPNTSKVIFDDTGHVPMLERPARFNRVLEEFLASE